MVVSEGGGVGCRVSNLDGSPINKNEAEDDQSEKSLEQSSSVRVKAFWG